MKITGKKVIQLNDAEKEILVKARRILGELADELDVYDSDLAYELNRAYETCLDVSREEKFEYEIDDGNE